ncbi:HAMP domain-containing protein [bacterium]|nr:HAMP domain-containing protein [bacterium]
MLKLNTDPAETTPEANLGQLDRVETRQVRLVVSIPALMFLLTLASTVVFHLYLSNIADKLPTEQLQSDARREAGIVLLIGLGVSILAGGAGIALAYSIVVPLKDLVGSMRQVALGDLTSKADVPRLGELHVLGSTFNRMVEQLQELFEQRDQQMRSSARGTVLTLDEGGRVLAADGSVRRILGIDGGDLLGKELLPRLRERLSDSRNRPFLKALELTYKEAQSGRLGVQTVDLQREEGEDPILCSISLTPMESPEQGGPSLLLDLRDLSAMRGFYEQIQRADRLAAIGTLATGIAHEIRNPLASIRAMAQLLQESATESPGEGARNYLERVLREVDRLERLVASIMDFASQEEVPARATDLNSVAHDAHEAARHRVCSRAMDGGWDTEWDLAEDLPTVLIEEARVSQALLNLMVNAMEAVCERTGGLVRIESRHEPGSSRPVVLRISNTSNPIPKEASERIFEPFYTTKAEGTGLGLPIAYQIVVANNGVLELDSSGGMVHFTVRFPLEGRRAKLPRS